MEGVEQGEFIHLARLSKVYVWETLVKQDNNVCDVLAWIHLQG